MNDSPSKRTVIVGIFVLIGLIFLIAGIFFIGNMHKTFEKKLKLVTFFDDVNGLQKGNYVWFSGVKIGTVSDLQFYGVSQVEVNIKIETNSQQYIRKDAKIKLGSDGFIGNKILVIYGGSENFPQVESGDTLLAEKTLSTEDMMNTLQKSNENLQVITSNFKTISEKLVAGEGTIGKLLIDNSLYNDIKNLTASLNQASEKAQETLSNISDYSAGLNKEGTLANQLVTDTVVFNSFKHSMLRLQQISDTASIFISDLKQASNNPKSSVGLLLNDEETGTVLKETIQNLESSSKKLDEDLEALQHNIFLRKFFKKRAKEAEKEANK